MATKNDVTGDELKSRGNTDAYKDGYERIWGSKNKQHKDVCAGAQHYKELTQEPGENQ